MLMCQPECYFLKHGTGYILSRRGTHKSLILSLSEGKQH